MNTKKSKASRPDTPPVPTPLGGTPPPPSKDDEGKKKFVPVEMIALNQLTMLPALGEIEAIKFLPDQETPRFLLIRKKDGSLQAELSDELAARQFELAWKIPAELHGLVNGLMHLTTLPRNQYGNDTGQMLFAMSETGQSNPYYLRPAAITLAMLELHLGDDLKRMLKQPDKKERIAAAQKIKKRFFRAVDALALQSLASPHGSKLAIRLPVGNGQEATMPLALAAIVEARKFVEEEEQREPTKAELRTILEQTFADEIKEAIAGDSYWTKVWVEAGLMGLEEGTPYRPTRKAI